MTRCAAQSGRHKAYSVCDDVRSKRTIAAFSIMWVETMKAHRDPHLRYIAKIHVQFLLNERP